MINLFTNDNTHFRPLNDVMQDLIEAEVSRLLDKIEEEGLPFFTEVEEWISYAAYQGFDILSQRLASELNEMELYSDFRKRKNDEMMEIGAQNQEDL